MLYVADAAVKVAHFCIGLVSTVQHNVLPDNRCYCGFLEVGVDDLGRISCACSLWLFQVAMNDAVSCLEVLMKPEN